MAGKGSNPNMPPAGTPSGEAVRTGDTALFPAPPPPSAPEDTDELSSLLIDMPPESEASPEPKVSPEPKASPESEALPWVGRRFEEFGLQMLESMAELERRLRDTFDNAVAAAKVITLKQADELIVDCLAGLRRQLQTTLDEMREDLDGKINALQNDVGDKASHVEVDGLSGIIGLLRGDIAAFRESVVGMKDTDDARREALGALNNQVHGFDGTMGTFKGRIKAVEDATNEARRELEALRQADTNLNAVQTRLATRVRGIEQALEGLKGAFKGIRDEVLPDVRKAAIRAEQAATAASAQVAELLPRLEYFGDLALEMRDLRSFMDRVAALERWRDRHSADIADVAERVELNELADELRGTLPRQ